jgi:hypothetical protein
LLRFVVKFLNAVAAEIVEPGIADLTLNQVTLREPPATERTGLRGKFFRRRRSPHDDAEPVENRNDKNCNKRYGEERKHLGFLKRW